MSLTYGVVGLVAAVTVIARLSRSSNLDAFPAAGSNTWFGSLWVASGLKYLIDPLSVMQDGYEKYRFAPFKVAEPNRWTLIVSDRGHLEELARAPVDQLSSAINDQIQLEYMLGSEIHHNPYHVLVIRSRLTRSLDTLYPEIMDEIVTSFDELLDLKGNEWKSVPAFGTVEKVICRTSNRVFVGLPLCRNPEWIDLCIRATFDLITGGILLGMLPKCVRRPAVRFTRIRQCIVRSMKLLGPVIEERRKHLRECTGDDKPNDFLSWLIEEAGETQSTPERLTTRIILVNFAAVHTSSNSFTQALFYLAANPRYIQPLREEVEAVVGKDGWSKSALSKMRKVDSFLRECQRMEGMSIVALTRKAVKDFMFADGTLVPRGTWITAAARSLHFDERLYKNANVFEPFRFAHADDSEESGKHHFTSTSTEYLPFGHGKHACPGRFFAANELKSMLAHIVVTYDVKLEEGATCPPCSTRIGNSVAANSRARVLFRNRVD